jgi:hypothetical protein
MMESQPSERPVNDQQMTIDPWPCAGAQRLEIEAGQKPPCCAMVTAKQGGSVAQHANRVM